MHGYFPNQAIESIAHRPSDTSVNTGNLVLLTRIHHSVQSARHQTPCFSSNGQTPYFAAEIKIDSVHLWMCESKAFSPVSWLHNARILHLKIRQLEHQGAYLIANIESYN